MLTDDGRYSWLFWLVVIIGLAVVIYVGMSVVHTLTHEVPYPY
jgi:hypothetical protein